MLFDINSILEELGYKELLDNFINFKGEKSLEEIYKKLNLESKETNYQCKFIFNNLAINAIVVFWSVYVKTPVDKRKLGNQDILYFFLEMLKQLDTENRDHLINAILNELRYPCNQTYYFSCLLLCIILEVKTEAIEEHILR